MQAGFVVLSTLCRYDIRMGLLLVRSWARVRRVSLWGGRVQKGRSWGRQLASVAFCRNTGVYNVRNVAVIELTVVVSINGFPRH